MVRSEDDRPLWFLEGGGMSGSTARSTDWAATPLGPPENWPQSLKSTVAMLLHSRHPMFLWWGEELIQFYNDAYLPSFGKGRHPRAMGQRGVECWQEIWPIIWPQIDDVMQRGKASWNEDHLVPIYRNDRLEEVYWTYGYSPVFNEQGAVAGTLVVCNETTARVISQRRLRASQALAEQVGAPSESESLLENAAAALGRFPYDVPFALFYDLNSDDGVTLSASVGLDGPGLQQVNRELSPYLTSLALGSSSPSHNPSVVALASDVTAGSWPEPVTQAYVSPLVTAAAGQLSTWAVFGISPRLSFDDGYRQHLQHLAERISQALAQRRAELERERLHREVRAERERLMNLFEQAPAFMCVLEGPAHVFTLANERYYDLVGRHDLVGKSVVEALPEVKTQGFIELLDDVYRTGRSHFGTSVPVQLERSAARSAEERFIDFVYQAFRGPDGVVVGIVVHGVDQTERHKAERAMRDADRRKDQFLAILAHELRNPLAPISNYSQLLEHFAHDSAAVKKAGAGMLVQVAQMVRLIDDLLDVSRVSSGKIELRRAKVELASVIEQAVDATRPYYDRANKVLELSIPDEPIWLDGDAARLSQVVGNLLHNAAKFTGDGGHVWLSVERSADCAVIRVRDDGIGIEAAQLPDIFEMFTQADTSLERSTGGLGIGLGLVRSLAQLHGGSVEVSSTGLGKGSEFVVRLPVAAPDQSEPSATGRTLDSPAPCARVLVVDDNRDACDSVAQLLRVLGHEVETAYDGCEGVALAEKLRPETILLDLGMPKLNGYEACRRIRAQAWSRNVTIIALTGWGQPADRRRTADAGFDAHLVKPVNVDEIKRLLARPRSSSSS